VEYKEAEELLEGTKRPTQPPTPQDFGRQGSSLYVTSDFSHAGTYALRRRALGPAVCFFAIDQEAARSSGFTFYEPQGQELDDLLRISNEEDDPVGKEKALVVKADSYDFVVAPGSESPAVVEMAAKSERGINLVTSGLIGILFLDPTPPNVLPVSRGK